MWIAEFKVWHAGSDSIELSERFDAVLSNFNLNLFEEKGKLHIVRCASFSGLDAQKFRKAFIEQERRVTIIASDFNQVFYYHPADKAFHTLLFDKNLIFVGSTITKKGFQYWTVASLKKAPLLALFKRIKSLGSKKATIELLSLKAGNVNLFAGSFLSDLTPLQLKAVQLARQYGYYDYPRKISLEELAKKAGVPRTTLQSHLRKAERTLIPKIVGKNTYDKQ